MAVRDLSKQQQEDKELSERHFKENAREEMIRALARDLYVFQDVGPAKAFDGAEKFLEESGQRLRELKEKHKTEIDKVLADRKEAQQESAAFPEKI